MHRTRPDDDNQTIVVTVQNPMHARPRAGDRVGGPSGARKFADYIARGAQLMERQNAEVVGRYHHGAVSFSGGATPAATKKPPRWLAAVGILVGRFVRSRASLLPPRWSES